MAVLTDALWRRCLTRPVRGASVPDRLLRRFVELVRAVQCVVWSSNCAAWSSTGGKVLSADKAFLELVLAVKTQFGYYRTGRVDNSRSTLVAERRGP